MTWVFWRPLFSGAGLIGGDLYPYYFPQKQLLADGLREGSIPLWNPLTGFGYPVLGESQTGALYPVHLLFYRWLSVNGAYNATQLLHYVLAFLGMFGFSRQLGLGLGGALLAATTWTFGWFPARICLEWAVIGGAWMSILLWSATAFLQRGGGWPWIGAASSLGLALLAGHYNLAFITLLTLPFLAWAASKPAVARAEAWRRRGWLAAAIGCGFLLASVQLTSSWELKTRSQRQERNDAFAPTYGHLPPLALSQLWAPWSWYAAEQPMDELLNAASWLAAPNATNQVEAQLYLGLAPVLLAVVGICWPRVRREIRLPKPWIWLTLTAVGLILATGWPTYFLANAPGFGFFRGPGRYSSMAAIAIALLAGATWDTYLSKRGGAVTRSFGMTVCLLALVCGDLWLASRQYRLGPETLFGRQVFYAFMVNDPPVNAVPESELRRMFTQHGGNVRLYAPGQNVPNLLGVSEIPVYLGLGPALYESDALRVDFKRTDSADVAEATQRLRRWGVTHLLLEEPIDSATWPVEPLGAVLDPVLNRALARREPYYFYRLLDAPGRIHLSSTPSGNRILSSRVEPNRVQVEVELNTADTLILRDLWYPGWEVTTPGLHGRLEDDYFRAVDLPAPQRPGERLSIEWEYRPDSLKLGIALSAFGVLSVLLGFWRLTRPSLGSARRLV